MNGASPPTTTVAASYMGDAIEQLTDDHVRRHALDPWFDLWQQMTVAELVDRLDVAIKSLAAARADLTGHHQLAHHQVPA